MFKTKQLLSFDVRMQVDRKHSTHANEYKRCMGSQSPLPLDAVFWWIYLSSHIKEVLRREIQGLKV
jgi:hypothetical protein